MEVLSSSLPFFTRPLYSATSSKTRLSLLFPRNLSPNLHCQFLNLLFLKHRTASYRFSSWGRYTEEEKEVEYSFEEAVQLFNHREYYKCHDVLEALWNKSEEPKRTLVHGILQCAVGLYHLFNQNHKGAMMELGEGLCKLRKMNFKNGPLQQFEKEISAVLDFIHQTQLELAAFSIKVQAPSIQSLLHHKDDHGVITNRSIGISDVWVLEHGKKVVCKFVNATPAGDDADGLLSQFLGTMARDTTHFPISFQSWPSVPASRNEDIFHRVIKEKWWFGNDDQAAFKYIMKDIGRKWKDNRLILWNKHYDITQPRDVNVRNPPNNISADDWAMFIDYRLNPKTKEMCATNTKNRALLTVPHTLGSKPIRRKKLELQSIGEQISREKMYIQARTKNDGSFVNEEARTKCSQIVEIETHDPTSIHISSNDSLARVLGKEHSGRVRSLGSGICPSVAFSQPSYRGSSSQRASSHQSAHEVSSSEIQLQQQVKGLQNEVQCLKSVMAVICNKCGIQMPAIVTNAQSSHSMQNEDEQHGSEDGGDHYSDEE